MVINKTAEVLTSQVSLANFTPAISAPVYRYDAANLSSIVQANEQSILADGFMATFPASSITLVVVPAGNRAESDQSGNWTTPATWLGDVTPAADDAVTISSGDTVTVDAAATCLQLTIAPAAVLMMPASGMLTLH
jgi:hypothetical protein